MPAIARIAVSAATFSADRPYDYSVPEELEGKVVPGVRVTVPFGQGNRAAEGIVLSVSGQSGRKRLKSVSLVLDGEPVLTAEQLSLALKLRGRLFCTVYELVRAMLPAALWYRLEHTWKLRAGLDRERAYEAAGVSEVSRTIVAALYSSDGEASEEVLREIAGVSVKTQLKRLADAGVIAPSVRETRRAGDKTVLTASLSVAAEDARTLAGQRKKKAPLQSAVLELLAEVGAAYTSELSAFTGASMQTLRRLEKEGLVELLGREVYRRPALPRPGGEPMPELNGEQETAFSGLKALLEGEKAAAALLYGVTGSGKTAVYIRLIEAALAMGRSAVVLVPEIALTPQLLHRFMSHFGDTVAVYHSSLSMGERYDEWKRVRNGLARVVIGTRSAVFAPVSKLGLMILDEEQERTYKSENNPRYHARDVARFRCADAGALLVLGSATPSVETMYAAKSSRISLFTLQTRYNERAMPRVVIADMKRELKNGNGGTISSVLRGEIEQNLERGEQSILFINRRGAASLVTCPECGHTFSCPRCSVNLTYHAVSRRLRCHYCGHSERMPEQCPECGGILKLVGAGTQKVEEELGELFPGAGVLRMDMDTVSRSNPHEAILSKFEKQSIPILVGTQMVAKGLDFPNVTLVGVVSADQLLYMGDYRSAERAFSLMTQVVGRSGRGSRSGRAVIQTFTPENEVLRLAAAQDYDGFYEREIELRRILGSPPVSQLFVLTVSGAQEDEVLHGCARIRAALEDRLSGAEGVRVLGPAPAMITKLNDRYRYRVTLVAPDEKRIRELVEAVARGFTADKRNRGLAVWADMDPNE